MTLVGLSGRPISKSTARYLIKWEGKSLSKMQQSVKSFLRKHWEGDIVYEEFPVFGTKMRLDFFNFTKKIAIEVQGAQHGNMIPFFHSDRTKYLFQLRRDNKKHVWCEMNKFHLVEILPKDLPLTEATCRKIGLKL